VALHQLSLFHATSALLILALASALESTLALQLLLVLPLSFAYGDGLSSYVAAKYLFLVFLIASLS